MSSNGRNLDLLKDVNTTITGEEVRTGPIKKTIQASGKTDSGIGAASINIEVTNDTTKPWLLAGTITLSLSTSYSSDGFEMDAAWIYQRAKVTSISGAGATISVIMGI